MTEKEATHKKERFTFQRCRSSVRELLVTPFKLNGRAAAGADLTFAVNVALIAACDLS